MSATNVSTPPLTAPAALDRYYLETRCKIIEIAANLDRLDRGRDAGAAQADPRVARLRQAIEALLDNAPNRAERCQMIFSLPYDANWSPPNRA